MQHRILNFFSPKFLHHLAGCGIALAPVVRKCLLFQIKEILVFGFFLAPFALNQRLYNLFQQRLELPGIACIRLLALQRKIRIAAHKLGILRALLIQHRQPNHGVQLILRRPCHNSLMELQQLRTLCQKRLCFRLLHIAKHQRKKVALQVVQQSIRIFAQLFMLAHQLPEMHAQQIARPCQTHMHLCTTGVQFHVHPRAVQEIHALFFQLFNAIERIPNAVIRHERRQSNLLRITAGHLRILFGKRRQAFRHFPIACQPDEVHLRRIQAIGPQFLGLFHLQRLFCIQILANAELKCRVQACIVATVNTCSHGRNILHLSGQAVGNHIRKKTLRHLDGRVDILLLVPGKASQKHTHHLRMRGWTPVSSNG